MSDGVQQAQPKPGENLGDETEQNVKQKQKPKNQNDNKNQNHQQQTSQSTVKSDSKSHTNTNSLQVLDHEPVMMSDDENDDDNINVTNAQLQVLNNDSSKDLRTFDSALDNSMVLDKEINTTLERSRHNSPKKKS